MSVAQRLAGDFAPKRAELTDDVLFGDVWARSLRAATTCCTGPPAKRCELL